MSKISKYNADNPSNTDKLIGTDENGETKNFILEKLAEFFTGFFQNNNIVDFRTPLPYPDDQDNPAIVGNEVDLDKVNKSGLWYFNKILKYKNGAKSIPSPTNSKTVRIEKFTDPNNTQYIFIKQTVFDFYNNKTYIRANYNNFLSSSDFKEIQATVI